MEARDYLKLHHNQTVWSLTMVNRIPVIDNFNIVMFYTKDKQTAASTYRRKFRDNALERCGFQVVVFESDPEIHGSHYFRCSYAK